MTAPQNVTINDLTLTNGRAGGGDGTDPAWPPASRVAASLEQVSKIAEGLKAAGVDAIKAYSGLSYRTVALLATEAKKASLPLVVDQGALNGSIDLMKTDMTAFAHLPVRTIDQEALELMTKKDIRIITTLAVAEFGTRRRFDDSRWRLSWGWRL